MPPTTDLTLPLDHDEIENGEHDIQFEIPHSIMSPNYKPLSANSKRPFSIDLSLELERQLELESLPNTPANANLMTASALSPATAVPFGTQAHHSKSGSDVLDPQILAHIVKQLRQSLADLTKERDDLLNMLSTAHSKEAELNDALQLMTDKATTMEEELSESRKKMRDDEEAISLLRTKVEESRRGLMRLQTENRRQSAALPSSLDLSRAVSSFSSGPTSSKRASFTPLTGSLAGRPNTHARMSSVSDSGLLLAESGSSFSPSTSPSHPDGHPTSPTPSEKMSRRISGIFGRSSPPRDTLSLHDPENESLKKEVQQLKDTIEELKHEVREAKEAREAADVCVNALRDFIAENHLSGENGATDGTVKLPPLPTDTTGEEEDTNKRTSGGWGFKLWKVDTTVKPEKGPASAASVASVAPSISVATPTTASTPMGTPQFAKKFGGFFTSRSSYPTPTTATAVVTPIPKRDSMQSGSDTSSIVEPLSPTAPSDNDDVRVRDTNSTSSELGSVEGSPTSVEKVDEGKHD